MATLPPLTKKSDHDALADTVATVQNSVGTISGELANRPTVDAVEDLIEEGIAGEELVVPSANGATLWDVSANEGLRLEVDGAVTLTATGIDTMLPLDAVLLKVVGTGTVTLSTGFADSGTVITADAEVQRFAYGREGTSLYLLNQPTGTVAGVDDGANSYTASDIAALEDRIAAAEAALAAGTVGTDYKLRIATKAALGLYADDAALMADVAASGLTAGDGTGATYTSGADEPTHDGLHLQIIPAA